MRFLKFFSFLAFVIVFSCKEDEKKTVVETNSKIEEAKSTSQSALFSYLEASQTNITFKNEIIETDNFNIITYEYLYNGGGVAIGDINNDGLDDIYFSGNTVNNRLYLNQGNFKFKDITTTAKVTGDKGFKTGVTMVDINNDGLLDIYVCKSAVNNEELRKEIWSASDSLCVKKPYENEPLIREILKLRQERAEILGKPDFADVALALVHR